MKNRTRLLITGFIFFSILLVAAEQGSCCGTAPRADLRADKTIVSIGESVEFDATGSLDPDRPHEDECDGVSMINGIWKFQWDWTSTSPYDYTETPGDGKATHSYSTAGIKTCKVKVYDNDEGCECSYGDCDDKMDTDTVDVRVVEVDNIVHCVPPYDNDGTLYACVGGSINLLAFSNPVGGGFPEGEPHWDINSQPPGGSATLSSTSGSSIVSLDNINQTGTYKVEAKSGTTDPGYEITIKAIELTSLIPTEGTPFDDGDEDPDTQSYVVCTASGTVTITATPNQTVPESDLPSCWQLTGGTGSGGLSRTIDKSTVGGTTITCTDGINTKQVKIYVVAVSVISIKHGEASYSPVTGQTIVVLKGSKYTFKASRYPSSVPWPSGAPDWSGAASGTGEETTVTFNTTGTQTITAKCCCGTGLFVTVKVKEPEVYRVGFSGDHTLYETPADYNGWGDGTTLISDPVFDSEANDYNAVCVTKNSDSVSLWKVRVKIDEALTFPTKIKLDATGTVEWDDSEEVTFSGTTTSSDASLNIAGNITDQVYEYVASFNISWFYKVTTQGTGFDNSMGSTNHTVYVKWGDPTGGHSLTEERIQWLTEECDENTTLTECSDDIFAGLDVAGQPPDFNLGGGNPTNKWHMMDPNGPSGQCIDLAMLMEDMYQLLGCGNGEIGYIYATNDVNCYSTSSSAFDTRTCPGGIHGTERLRYYTSSGWNNWEAVFHVNGNYYAVQETSNSDPLQVIQDIVGDNDPNTGNYQAWRYLDGVWNTCNVPGPCPVSLPP